MMGTSHEIRSGRHSERVAAWIYTIINPLIDAMRSETQLLSNGDLSWRAYSKRTEHIRTVREHVEAHYLPNFDDFLADNQEFVQKFEIHDNAVRNVQEKALTFFDILLSGQIFREQVNRTFEEYESKIKVSQPSAPSLESMKDDLPKYVAENLINNVETFPSHYTIHKFWELFGEYFRSNISEFEAHKQRNSFVALQGAKVSLREAAKKLQSDLENYRLQLCREFDLPAAQPTPPRSRAEDRYFTLC